MLYECGVFEEQAVKIMDVAIPMFEQMTPDHKVSLDSPSEGYPDAFYTVGFLTVKRAAVQWIDAEVFGGTVRRVAVDWLDEDLWSESTL